MFPYRHFQDTYRRNVQDPESNILNGIMIKCKYANRSPIYDFLLNGYSHICHIFHILKIFADEMCTTCLYLESGSGTNVNTPTESLCMASYFIIITLFSLSVTISSIFTVKCAWPCLWSLECAKVKRKYGIWSPLYAFLFSSHFD